MLQRRRRLAGGRPEAAVVEAPERGAGQVGDRLGVLDQIGDLVLPVGRQGEDRQHPEAQQGEAHRRELHDVGQLQHDPVAPGQAQAPQPVGQPVGGGVELGVGHRRRRLRRAGGRHGDAVAARRRPAAQEIAEPLAPPVTVPPVALGELLREGHAAVEHHRNPCSCSRWPALWART